MEVIDCRGSKCRQQGEKGIWCEACHGEYEGNGTVLDCFYDNIRYSSIPEDNVKYVKVDYKEINEDERIKHLTNADENLKQRRIKLEEDRRALNRLCKLYGGSDLLTNTLESEKRKERKKNKARKKELQEQGRDAIRRLETALQTVEELKAQIERNKKELENLNG